MSQPHPRGLSQVSVILPALNEAKNLEKLLPRLQSLSIGQIIVGDNGSSDNTKAVIQRYGADWAYEPRPGYGAACFRAMQRLNPSCAVVVFLDADLSDDPSLLPALVEPISSSQCDMVIGTRVRALREPGAMTFPQRLANWLFPILIRAGWGFTYTDLGPFRAIRRTTLNEINMQDRAFGWTIEMQIRAVEIEARIREVPVPYRCRSGRSKISGTVRGVILAAYWIIRTCAMLWLTKHRRLSQSISRVSCDQ